MTTPPAPHVARYAAQEATFDGGTVPAGSARLCLVGVRGWETLPLHLP